MANNLFGIIVAAIFLSGCAFDKQPDCPQVPTPKSQVIDKSCDMYVTVTPRKGDVFTNETAKQILGNNDKFAAHCNQKTE